MSFIYVLKRHSSEDGVETVCNIYVGSNADKALNYESDCYRPTYVFAVETWLNGRMIKTQTTKDVCSLNRNWTTNFDALKDLRNNIESHRIKMLEAEKELMGIESAFDNINVVGHPACEITQERIA